MADPRILITGIEYPLRMTVTGPTQPFPKGCRVRADVRETPSSEHAIAELSFQNGGLVYVDENTIDIILTDKQTAKIGNSQVFIDFVRTDLSPPAALYVLLQIPVIRGITRLPA